MASDRSLHLRQQRPHGAEGAPGIGSLLGVVGGGRQELRGGGWGGRG